jgi:hypothetical protein
MKRFYLFLMASLLFIGLAVSASAQDDGLSGEKRGKREKTEKPEKEKAEKAEKPEKGQDSTLRMTYGLFANVQSGFTYGAFGKLKESLAEPTVFDNQDFVVRGLGSSIGGSVHGLLFKRLIIGGGGTRYSYDASLSERPSPQDTAQYNSSFETLNRGEAKVTTTLYNIHLGFAALNRENHLLFPYVGYSFGSQELRVQNYSPDIMNLGGSEIDRARTETFKSNVGVVDFGVGYRYVMKRNGGLMVGAELGGYVNVGKNDWESEDGMVLQNVQQSSLMGGYLRFTVGGGIFSTNAKALGIVPEVKEKKEKEPKPKKEKKVKGESAE